MKELTAAISRLEQSTLSKSHRHKRRVSSATRPGYPQPPALTRRARGARGRTRWARSCTCRESTHGARHPAPGRRRHPAAPGRPVTRWPRRPWPAPAALCCGSGCCTPPRRTLGPPAAPIPSAAPPRSADAAPRRHRPGTVGTPRRAAWPHRGEGGGERRQRRTANRDSRAARAGRQPASWVATAAAQEEEGPAAPRLAGRSRCRRSWVRALRGGWAYAARICCGSSELRNRSE